MIRAGRGSRAAWSNHQSLLFWKILSDIMEPIFHLVVPEKWHSQVDSDFRTDSLDTEGFIHCSFARQVEWAANRFYPDAPALLVLTIAPERLKSPLKIEFPPGKGSKESDIFPHIHGPLNRSAVVEVREMKRSPSNEWVLPS